MIILSLILAISSALIPNVRTPMRVEHKVNLEDRAAQALLFCRANKLNSNYCILIDMNIHAGKNRLFVYNFKKKEVVIEGMCAHGSGGGSTAAKPVYSNKVGSFCTSLGKYKLGKRSYSRWGINVHYKMHGLESTNSNAFERVVVLHSYDPVPEMETYPLPLFGVSSGCPVVANGTMKKIDALLKTGESNMLLWIYN